MSRQSTALITLGSNGDVSYQRLAHDDIFTLVRDNDHELTQLFAEGHFDAGMYASNRHPLFGARNDERESQRWLAGSSRRSRRVRHRKK